MRTAFADEDDVAEEPEIVVKGEVDEAPDAP